MLSVCIPVYRYDVRPLVTELLRQTGELKDTVEILVYDDASPDDGDWGKTEMRRIPEIQYVELEQNLGRAGIRNLMARRAKHDFLVMMDADGEPNSEFLQCWLGLLRKTRPVTSTELPLLVIVGGRHYARERPSDPALSLHWWYGRQRESSTRRKRKKAGWLGFHSNNFLVTRSVLLDHPFPETHAGYGHEDTLWGQQLIGSEIKLIHADNPVVHLGLETNEVFLRKQKQAIANLRVLKNSYPHLRTRLTDLAGRFPLLAEFTGLLPESLLTDYLTKREEPFLYTLDMLKLKWWNEER